MVTRRSQHSQECKDPRRQCFCGSWPSPLTFDSTITGVFRPRLVSFLAALVQKPDRHTVKRGQKAYPATAVGGGMTMMIDSTTTFRLLALLKPPEAVSAISINKVSPGRNRTGPPYSVGRPTAHGPGNRRPAHPLTHWQRYRRRRRRQTTDASEQNNTGPFGEPVIIL